jgi:hypothetical protein
VRFHLEHRFLAPLEKVEDAMVDPAFLEGTRLPDVAPPRVLSREESGPTITLRVRYQYTGSLDSLARRVLRVDDVNWVQESRLDRTTHRTEFKVVPGVHPDRFRCGGTMQLRQEGNETVRGIDGELRIRVPIFSGRAEGLIVPGLRSRMNYEAELLADWVNRPLAG